jgi:hypothetical protein
MRLHPVLDLRAFIATTIAVIRERGWVSRARAYAANAIETSTASIAYGELFKPAGVKPTVEDLTVAGQAVEWAENMQPASSYDETVKLVVGSGSGAFTLNQIGVVASVGYVYPRRMRELMETALREQQPVKNGGYLAEIGAEIEISARLLSATPFTNKWGVGVVLTFQTGDGRIAKVFGKEDLVATAGLKAGGSYQIAGRVKDHKVWHGRPETIIHKVNVLT